MDGRLVELNNSVVMISCSDIVGVPPPSYMWTYADHPINTGMINIAYTLYDPVTYQSYENYVHR